MADDCPARADLPPRSTLPRTILNIEPDLGIHRMGNQEFQHFGLIEERLGVNRGPSPGSPKRPANYWTARSSLRGSMIIVNYDKKKRTLAPHAGHDVRRSPHWLIHRLSVRQHRKMCLSR
jgi:hypothetical protein